MSRMCDSCDNKFEGVSYEFKGTLMKKGGKRPIKIELEDICTKCVLMFAKQFGIKLPGNFGGKRRARKTRGSTESSFSGPSEPTSAPAPASTEKPEKKKPGRPPKPKKAAKAKTKTKAKAKKGDGKGKRAPAWGQPDDVPPPETPSPPPAPNTGD